jgi:hypothetical protein
MNVPTAVPSRNPCTCGGEPGAKKMMPDAAMLSEYSRKPDAGPAIISTDSEAASPSAASSVSTVLGSARTKLSSMLTSCRGVPPSGASASPSAFPAAVPVLPYVFTPCFASGVLFSKLSGHVSDTSTMLRATTTPLPGAELRTTGEGPNGEDAAPSPNGFAKWTAAREKWTPRFSFLYFRADFPEIENLLPRL